MSLPSMATSGSTKTRKTDHSAKSLTPQRKHRKLLKDGSGTEVWPEGIEKVFVEGLRQYWQSPWATYSRGRSRWRNQFLVDYLQRAGITRTKKQVASHIQVLRNMWKGEQEFHLVAGGEELFLEAGLLGSVKTEDQHELTLIPLEFDDTDTASSQSSPNFSDFTSEFPSSPSGASQLYVFDSYSPDISVASLTSSPEQPISPILSSPKQYDATLPSEQAGPSRLHSSPFIKSAQMGGWQNMQTAPSMNVPSSRGFDNRVTRLELLADGMAPFSVRVDALVPRAQSPGPVPTLSLKVKLSLASISDIRSPPTLHGFAATVCFSNVWTTYGKCATKVYAGGVCISEELEAIQVSSVDVGVVNAVLPDSSLTRCRWLDASVQTALTQEIIVDNTTLLLVVYDLDRNPPGSLPRAELIGFRKYRPSGSAYASNTSQTYSPPRLSYSQSLFPTYNGSTPPSLSCALTPSSIKPVISTSSSF
ncbi:uncharacterized protein BT62DRAFT_925107 [Guyanagaster necrorhizus]|uniref:TEA domain-containing protein n=1 Tax=Guyanagaster necrorhizus TaxID=856835 RepID=A0A9P7W5Y4_9AGAR|nr:uncharacterized protein BT62DRAFT_925107 [Guyanagaster necrorhizus MCA 3950]KAG7452550.1 hypothetical protein BT62DRAFT_925107 [Guyanagaster necrorhizus MCA 3950]